MRRYVLSTAFAAIMTVAGGHSALAQQYYDNSSRALYDRIDRLERDLQTMQGQMARGSGGSMVVTSPALGGGSAVRPPVDSSVSPAAAVRLDERVDQLEEMVRQLTGRVEEANFKTSQVAKQLERMQADIDLRFKDLQSSGGGGGGAAAGGAQMSMAGAKSDPAPQTAPGPQTLGTMPEKDMKRLTAQQQPATPPTAAKPQDAQGMYDAAYSAAQTGDYDGAERGFKDFLNKYPTNARAGDAQYWLGDIAYAQKDFGTAAATFLEAYKKYPKHSKAPDMIYKAGSSFGQLGKKKEACTAFGILFNDNPNMPDRVKRAALAEKQRYDCK